MSFFKKLFFILLTTFVLFSFSCTRSNNEDQEFLPTDENVKQVGRTFMGFDSLLLCFSGTGAAFEVNAKRLDVEFIGDSNTNGAVDLDNGARVVVFVNGERKLDKIISKSKEVVTIFNEKKPVSGEVEILKVSESTNSLAGISKIILDKEGSIKPAAKKDLKIEFIGDSITCGYGVDDPVKENHFKTSTEDNTKTYAYKTAKALGADYSMVCLSGFGILSGYTNNGRKNTNSLLPKYYEKLGFTWNTTINGINPGNKDWNFHQFVPDFIVINLGTNDNSYVKKDEEKTEEFKSAYKAFLKQIRKNNPDASIVCSLGMMGTDLCKAVEEVVEEYSAETGDNKVTSLRFSNQNMADGIAADWHPSEKTHEKAALVLTSKIKRLI